MVDSAGRADVASGPITPWVREDWGSASTSRTRRPCLARTPPRLAVSVVFETPPFWFSITTTGTVRPPGLTRVAPRNAPVLISTPGAPDLKRCAAQRRPRGIGVRPDPGLA